MELKDKIVTREELIEVLGASHFTTYVKQLMAKVDHTGTMSSNHIGWWTVREKARIAHGVYELTEPLTELNAVNPTLFAHVSKDDPSMVAYTPDYASGAADRQIRSSIGKLLGRYMPFLTEEGVRTRVEAHQAELSCEVLWMEGQEIVDLYVSGKGAGACMSAKTFAVQPTVAYMQPHIKLAYLKGSDGYANSRCIVVHLGDEKRYIRAYGDPKLLKRLQRLGYTPGGWQNVPFNMVEVPPAEGYPVEDGFKRFAMPYLDQMGSAAGEGSWVAYVDGVLRGVTKQERTRFTSAGLNSNFFCTPTTAGYVNLKEVKTAEYSRIDAFTGQPFSLLAHDAIQVMINGALGWTTAERQVANMSEAEWVSGLAVLNVDNEVRTFPNVKMLRTEVFRHSGSWYFENAEAREALHFVKLDEELYPELRDWFGDYETCEIRHNGRTVRALQEDTFFKIEKVDGIEVMVRAHKSTFDKRWIKLHLNRDRAYDCYIDPKSGVEIQKTVSGRKVHREYNTDVVVSWKGLDFARNANETIRFYKRSWACASKDRNSEEFKAWKEVAEAQAREEWVQEVCLDVRQAAHQMFRLAEFQGRLVPSATNTEFVVSASRYTVEEREVYGYYRELIEDLWRAPRRQDWEETLDYKALRRALQLQFAEAEAKDYNLVTAVPLATTSPESSITVLPLVEVAETVTE